MGIFVHRRPASPQLAPFVSGLYYQRAARFPHARERALASGGTQLLVNLAADELWRQPAGAAGQRTPGAALQGPDSRPAVIDPAHQREIICVAFRPAGAYPFFGPSASAVRDQLVPLEDLWGRDGATLPERLRSTTTPAGKLRAVEAVLLARLAHPLEPDPAVAAAAAALHRGATVAEVSDRLGWTRQRLAACFAERVGLTPKRFARVRRFQRLVASVAAGGAYGRGVDWGRLAVEGGYHDQAHMIHDFRAFAGLSPTEYAPRSPAERNHVPL